MNCHEFTSLVHEFVRERCGEEINAAVRAHVSFCASCAAQLRDARALAEGLAAMASESAEAPSELELSLRKAFRRSAGLAQRPPIRPDTEASTLGWLTAMAAGILLLTVSSFVYREYLRQPVQNVRTTTPRNVHPSGPASRRDNPLQVPAPGADKAGGFVDNAAVAAKQPPIAKQESELPERRADSAPAATATDFLPVTYVGDLRNFDSLQVVRTRVSSTTMVSFGLPFDPNRAGASVAADLLISPDGVVRAIRFVR